MSSDLTIFDQRQGERIARVVKTVEKHGREIASIKRVINVSRAMVHLAQITDSRLGASVGLANAVIEHAWQEVEWDAVQKRNRLKTDGVSSTIELDPFALSGVNRALPQGRIPKDNLVLVHMGLASDGKILVWLEEIRPAPETFPARIDGATGPSTGPWLYDWTELRWTVAGGLESFNGARRSIDQGMKQARGYGEMVTGFGVTVGPWGQPLVTGRGVLVPLRFPNLAFVPMVMERDRDGGPAPRFSAPNPMMVVCNA